MFWNKFPYRDNHGEMNLDYILEHLGGDGSGGSGGSGDGVFVVSFTFGDNDDLICDKTFEEIKSAYESKTPMVAYLYSPLLDVYTYLPLITFDGVGSFKFLTLNLSIADAEITLMTTTSVTFDSEDGIIFDSGSYLFG